jgi:hypothetical protein
MYNLKSSLIWVKVKLKTLFSKGVGLKNVLLSHIQNFTSFSLTAMGLTLTMPMHGVGAEWEDGQ